MDLVLKDKKDTKGEEGIERSFVRRNWRRAKFIAGSPVANVGFEEISEGRRFIRQLWGLVKRGAPADTRLKIGGDGSIDLMATAFVLRHERGGFSGAAPSPSEADRASRLRDVRTGFRLGGAVAIWRVAHVDEQCTAVLGTRVPAFLHAVLLAGVPERPFELAA